MPTDDATSDSSLPANLPPGSELQFIEWVTDDRSAPATLAWYRDPVVCRAIALKGTAATSTSSSSETLQSLSLLLIPTPEHDSPELTAAIWSWLEPEQTAESRTGLMIMLQGTTLFWTPSRAAIVAPPARWHALLLAVLEFTFHDGQLRQIEHAIAAAWPELQADSAVAFFVDDQAASRRDELSGRFQRAISLRSLLVRINPLVNRPPIHPLTLAGQLGERLKERTKLVERIEFVGDQLEVFEHVYEMCGQRVSDHAIGLEGRTLEWVIILLLAVESVVLLVGLLSAQGT